MKEKKQLYQSQCEEWLKKHPNATLKEAWVAGYFQSTTNWVKQNR